jgi:hypothetical protein
LPPLLNVKYCTNHFHAYIFKIVIVGLPAVDDVLAVDGDPAVADLHAVTVIHDSALVHAVADIHAIAGVSSVVGRIVTGTFALALALVHAVTGTHDAVIRVSAVVGFYCCWRPCLMMLQKCLAVVYSSSRMPEQSSGPGGDLLHSPMSEKSSGHWIKTFYILPCRKTLVPEARPGLISMSQLGRNTVYP